VASTSEGRGMGITGVGDSIGAYYVRGCHHSLGVVSRRSYFPWEEMSSLKISTKKTP